MSVRVSDSGKKVGLFVAIATLIVGPGCGSGGVKGGRTDAGGFEGCLPACIADILTACAVPAGACTSESVAADATSSCYSGGIKTLVYSDAGALVSLAATGACYEVYPVYRAVNSIRLQSLEYSLGVSAMYGCITMDATDPTNRKGVVQCGVGCGAAPTSNVPAQPFDFDNPACSFFRFQPSCVNCTITDGIAYDDPAQTCAQGATGSCPSP